METKFEKAKFLIKGKKFYDFKDMQTFLKCLISTTNEKVIDDNLVKHMRMESGSVPHNFGGELLFKDEYLRKNDPVGYEIQKVEFLLREAEKATKEFLPNFYQKGWQNGKTLMFLNEKREIYSTLKTVKMPDDVGGDFHVIGLRNNMVLYCYEDRRVTSNNLMEAELRDDKTFETQWCVVDVSDIF